MSKDKMSTFDKIELYAIIVIVAVGVIAGIGYSIWWIVSTMQQLYIAAVS